MCSDRALDPSFFTNIVVNFYIVTVLDMRCINVQKYSDLILNI